MSIQASKDEHSSPAATSALHTHGTAISQVQETIKTPSAVCGKWGFTLFIHLIARQALNIEWRNVSTTDLGKIRFAAREGIGNVSPKVTIGRVLHIKTTCLLNCAA